MFLLGASQLSRMKAEFAEIAGQATQFMQIRFFFFLA